MADSSGKAEPYHMSSGSDRSNGGRSHVKKASKDTKKHKPAKFKEGSKVWIKADRAISGATGSLFLSVVTVYRDPITSSLSYKLEDTQGRAFKDGKAIAETELGAAS